MSLPDTVHSFSVPKIPALRVWVTVEGEPLQLYTTETLSKQGCAYFEVREGERFELHMCDQREKKPTNAWNVEFHVDGQWGAGIVAKPSDSLYSTSLTHPVRPYRFTKLATTSNDDSPHASCRTVAHLGVIEFQYSRVKWVRPMGDFRVEPKLHLPVHEQDKKVELEHRIELDDPEPYGSDDEETDSFCKIDKRKPWTTICLFYRSKEFLKSLGFIPNSRSPSPAASSDLEILESATPPIGSSTRSPSIAAAGAAAKRLASLEAREHVVQAELEALQAEQEARERVKREELDEIREEIKRVRGGEGDAEEKPQVKREDTSGAAGALDMQNKARSKSKGAEKAACGTKTEVLVLE
ncbi:uncharacterized protein JCM10292_000686 [Rhodotorula paludigena]|uniref:uncharacterized protein n=1 Tax=Rhodotorula paludigena TaxID=86838 RepID=UPI003171F08F